MASNANVGFQEDLFSFNAPVEGNVVIASLIDTSPSIPLGEGSLSEPANVLKHMDVFIPNERMGMFLRKMEKIQAQARKLNLPEWDVVIGEKEWRLLADKYPVDLYPGQHDPGPLKIEGSMISISGQAPVLDGWRFLAKIEHDAGGNLVKSMVSGDNSPAEWHVCKPNCDHCGVSRERNNTFMLKNVESGAVKQVGSSCMSDFLGHDQRDPERIAAMFDHLVALEEDFEFDPDRDLGGAGLSDLGVEPVKLMAATLKIVEEDGGYLSAEKADSLSCMSTGDRLRAAFWSAKPIAVKSDVGHAERAQQVVAWLKDQKADDSLWLRNIAHLADRACITAKNAGLFASGYVAWNRDLQKQLRQERGAGDWVGEAGAKIATAATLERRGAYENAYGVVSVLSFRDEEGNGMVWKTQSPPQGLMVGATYHVAATVKAHGEYKGEKQTEVIRVKVAELELFSFGALPGFKKAASMASPDVADESGHTPLLKAVFHDKPEHAKLLLAAGADANQLNQLETPVLAYATSVAMAQVLLDAGARAVDVSPADLQGMEADARAVVAAAAALVDVDGPGGGAAVLAPMDVVVKKGVFSGMVVSVEDGLVTQRINRAGDVVRHDASRLSAAAVVGHVVDISYADERGLVNDRSAAKKLER